MQAQRFALYCKDLHKLHRAWCSEHAAANSWLLQVHVKVTPLCKDANQLQRLKTICFGCLPAANLDLSLSKGGDTAAAAAAATSGVTVLSAPQVSVDLSIKKEAVPLLTVSDAPCKKICKDKCTITLENHCMTVDVPKKVRVAQEVWSV
jgi:hypothetical protein